MNKQISYKRRKDCRICNYEELEQILDLGETPLANAFINRKNINKKERTFPLTVHYCKNCSLVQVPDVVNPKILFSDYYFLTSASSPSIDHFIKYGKDILDKFIKSGSDLVIDIGGNDGVLLNELKNKCRILNIEPAKNIAAISRKKGIETLNDFFTKKVASKILKDYGKVKVVTANNIIAHTDTVKELFKGVADLIADAGVFIFETHWVRNLIGEGGFDQVYHEHLCYYSLHALCYMAESVGLKIFDVITVPMQGESLRLYASKNIKPKISVKNFLEREKKLGLNKSETFSSFSEKVLKNKAKTMNLLNSLKDEGKKIVGYGAPAKGSTLLNFYGIDNKIIDYIVDTTPLKQGMLTPGTHIPIYSPDKLNQSKPDYVLILAWNYADAILKKEENLRNQGVKFIIPVPKVVVV